MKIVTGSLQARCTSIEKNATSIYLQITLSLCADM